MNKRVLLSATTIALVVIGGLPVDVHGDAGTLYTWPTPQRIPEYYDMLRAPVLVADQDRSVYAFDLERTEGQDYAVMVRTWTLAAGWSSPIDVMLPAFLGIAPQLQDAYLGDEGVLHLIYYGGTQTEGSIFYSHAYASEADRSQAWSEPVPVGSNAGPVAAAAIGRVGQNGLVIAYAGDRQGQGLYVTYSLDTGETWSEPIAVVRTGSSDRYIGSLLLETDDRGRVHLVWDAIDGSGQGVEFGYVRLSAEVGRWDHAAILGRSDTDLEAVGAPSIVSEGDNLYIVYQDGYPPTRWMRESNDGGATWSPPVRPFPHVGGYGVAVLLKDSAGQIHMVLGNRLPSPEIHGMWYSRLVNDQWFPLEPIISGRATSEFDPCCPQAIISQGNVLLATWPHNVRQEHLTGAWYSYALLDAPELAAVPPPAPAETVASPVPSPLPSEVGGSVAVPSTPDSASSSGYDPRPRRVGNPAGAVFAGVTPVVLLLALLSYDRMNRRRTPPHSQPEEPGRGGAGGQPQ